MPFFLFSVIPFARILIIDAHSQIQFRVLALETDSYELGSQLSLSLNFLIYKMK